MTNAIEKPSSNSEIWISDEVKIYMSRWKLWNWAWKYVKDILENKCFEI